MKFLNYLLIGLLVVSTQIQGVKVTPQKALQRLAESLKVLHEDMRKRDARKKFKFCKELDLLLDEYEKVDPECEQKPGEGEPKFDLEDID